jgi:mRNA-degrading endonuclease RelE of RelBE toxin-antitoxin system
MKLSSKIKFADEKIKKSFDRLGPEENQLKKHLLRALKDIQSDASCGIQIPKKNIPLEYSKKYNVVNLWKYNLPGAWRLIYSIKSDGIVIISIILEWLDHKTYERKFNY